MRHSTRLNDTVHLMVSIALNGDTGLMSTDIAESIETNPAYVRKFMSILKSENLIVNTPGHLRPALARNASEVSLLDVYRAVEGDKSLLHLDTHTNPECGMGVMIQMSPKDYYDGIRNGIEADMAGIALQDVIDNYHRRCESVRFRFLRTPLSGW